MATYRTTSYGNLSGTTNSKFRAVIEVYADDNGSNGYKVYSRCYLEVTQGNFNGTNANVSWSGSLVSIGGAGKYADTGQVYEGVYSYNSTFTKSISCGYSTSKHNYKSSCSMNWKVPSLPTYYLGIGQRVDNKEGITLGSGYKFRDYGKGNYILLDNQADDGWAIQALYLNKNEYGNKLKYGLYNYSTLGLTKKGYHNNGTWREQKSGRIVGQDEEFTYGSLIDANRGDSVKNRDSISVFDTIWYLNEAYIYMRANGGQLSSTEKWAIDSNGNIYDKNKTSESDAWIIIYTYGDNVDLYNYSTLGLIKKGYHNNGTWKELSTGKIYGQDEIFNVVNLKDVANKSTVENTSRINSVFEAIWYPNKYTVTYNLNGGKSKESGSTKGYSEDIYYDEQFLASTGNMIEKAGYKFIGWNTKPNGSGTDWTPYIYNSVRWTYEHGVTLYAQWEMQANCRQKKNGTYKGGMMNQKKNNVYKTGRVLVKKNGVYKEATL